MSAMQHTVGAQWSQPVTAEFLPVKDRPPRRPMARCSHIRLATGATWPRESSDVRALGGRSVASGRTGTGGRATTRAAASSEHCSVVNLLRLKSVSGKQRSRPVPLLGKALDLGKDRANAPRSPVGVRVAARVEGTPTPSREPLAGGRSAKTLPITGGQLGSGREPARGTDRAVVAKM